MLLKLYMDLEQKMVNAERCMQMILIPHEREINKSLKSLLQDRPNWPEDGKLQFKGVSLKYRPNTEEVLHKLSFLVEPGQKIGIVGRTGAGKSTICLSISRIIEIFEGQIEIDGVDI